MRNVIIFSDRPSSEIQFTLKDSDDYDVRVKSINELKEAEKYRAEGKVCSLYVKPKKMGKFLSKLQERGYAGFINVSNGDEISDFE